jgi:hypothetical protein
MYRLLLVSCVVAAKYLSDEFATNSYYARVGGIGLEEINILEHLFLEYLDFDLSIDSEVF